MLINMNSTNKTYSTSDIRHVEFDNLVSLQLSSDDPIKTGESISIASEYFNRNPFITNIG